MKRLVLAFSVALLAGPALALPSLPHLPEGAYPRDVCGIQIPPARFDLGRRATTRPIDGPHAIPARQVARECRGSGEPVAVGCTTAILLGRTILAYRVVLADRPPPGTDRRCTPAKWRASLLRHERAHMAGWPPHHSR